VADKAGPDATTASAMVESSAAISDAATAESAAVTKSVNQLQSQPNQQLQPNLQLIQLNQQLQPNQQLIQPNQLQPQPNQQVLQLNQLQLQRISSYSCISYNHGRMSRYYSQIISLIGSFYLECVIKSPKTIGQKSDTNNRVKIKLQRGVKMIHFQLYHMLVTDEQLHKTPKEIPNKYNFFGTVVSRGKNKSSWNVKWEVLPVNDNVINNISRSKLTVVIDGEEERPINDNERLDEVEVISDTHGNTDNGCSPGKNLMKMLFAPRIKS